MGKVSIGTLIFPIDMIEKEASVVLYGAGKNGRYLFEQNKKLSWCNIVAVLDQREAGSDFFSMKVKSPESISELEGYYDYILISVASVSAKREIIDNLLRLGVQYENIVDELPGYYLNKDLPVVVYNKDSIDRDKLQIAFHPGGVMGDQVIALRLYQEIIKIAPNSEIDVLEHFQEFPGAIFYGQKNLREIIYHVPCEDDRDKYDLIIESHFEPSIVYCNMSRLEALTPELAKRIKVLYGYQTTNLFRCSPAQYMNRLQWDRAKFKGWNCYTFLGSSGALDIDDMKVELHINVDFKTDFENLGLRQKYCTFNYGASDPLKTGKPQTKMWPYEYYHSLIKDIKREFPEIQVVQIGGAEVNKVQGADKYVLGENLEVAKHVLKNSMFHFDCEGGLVHIASALGTKCFVVFGPTPVSFFGYSQNVNIVSEGCKECCGLTVGWYNYCYKYDRPECMYSIKPEIVYEKIKEFILLMEKRERQLWIK